MKKIVLSLLIVITFICTACPYESAISIDKPKIAINKTLIGTWKSIDARQEPDNYDIRKAGDFIYHITENTYSKEDRSLKQKKYTAFISELDGKSYLNVKMIKDSINVTVSDNYFLYQIELKDRNLKLLPLSQYIREQFINPVELQNFIKKYQSLSFFYGEHSEYIKVND